MNLSINIIPKMQEYLNKTQQELKLRNYSPQTMKSYLACLEDYFSSIRTGLGIL